MSIQYYDPVTGCWLGSYQEGTPCRYLEAAPAPADANGFYGCEGMRWDGMAWVDDPTASDQAVALMYPEQTLAQERTGMVADKWQIVAALDLEDPALWRRITDYAEGVWIDPDLPPCDPITRSAIRNAITIPRMSQIVDLLAWLLAWDTDEVDALFRRAMAIRG